MKHAAERTTSRRRAAGSRRNKRMRYVGRRLSDSTPTLSGTGAPDGQFDWKMAPCHEGRAIDIRGCFPLLEGQG